MKARLVEEKSDHFVMDEGGKQFRVAKFGLSDGMHQRIRGMASGGAVEGKYPAMPKPKDPGRVSVGLGELTLDPNETREERKAREHEEETGGHHAPHAQQRHEPTFAEQVTDFARRASTSVRGMAEGGGVEDVPERRDAGPMVFVPAGDGGLRPVPAAQFAAQYQSYQPPAQAPAQAPAPTGPSQDALDGVRHVYEATGPAGAQALGRLADEPQQRADATNDFQRSERAKLTTLRPRDDGTAPPPTPDPAVPPKPTARGAGGAPAPIDNGLTDAQAAVDSERAAIEQRGGYEAGLARENARILGTQRQAMQAQALSEKEMRDRAHVEAQHISAQRDALSEELRNVDTKVDPGRYWASKNTGQKLLGIIGLALGAVGAGNDGVNRAAMLMGQAIDRDIEAQKAEHTLTLQKGEQRARALDSMYAQHHQLYQDDLASLAATKATALELANNQLQQAAATYASPIAKANAQALSAQLQGTIAKFKADAAAKTEERRHHIALEGIESGRVAVAAAGGGDKEALHTAQAVRERSQVIRDNLAKADGIIKRVGTFELTGADESDLRNALSSIATDMAKLKDPQSAARPGEVEQEMKNLGFEAGTLTTSNATARELLTRYRRAVDAREQEALKVRGFLK